MEENFISCEQVWEALYPDGPPQESGFVDVRPIVERMTGLDMTKYHLVAALNAHGWYIEKMP